MTASATRSPFDWSDQVDDTPEDEAREARELAAYQEFGDATLIDQTWYEAEVERNA